MRKELVEKKNDMITRAQSVLDAAKTEKRELTEAEAAELAEIRDNVRRIVEMMKLEDDIDRLEEKKDDTPREKEEEMTEEKKVEEIARSERAAFENYIRGRVIHERAGELAKADNGAVIPKTIADMIIKRVYEISPIMERATRFNIAGTLDVPVWGTDAQHSGIQMAYANDFTALTSTTGIFSSVSLTGYLAGVLTKIGKTLINNVKFDVVAFVVEEMAQSIRRFMERELLIGTSGKIEGLSVATNIVTAGAANAIVAEDLISVQDAVIDSYQDNAIWIMSSATRTALRKLKGNDGHFLLQDDITAPFGKVLLGKPVYVSDNMPNVATGAKAIYYGDMRGLAVKFSEDMNIDVLRERFADEHAVGVVGWIEADSKVIDNQKISVLQMA